MDNIVFLFFMSSLVVMVGFMVFVNYMEKDTKIKQLEYCLSVLELDKTSNLCDWISNPKTT